MSIKFICSCGKHLRARDEMAARRSVCPRCGSPVGIPSLDPNHPAPMTPAERRRHADRRRTPSLDEAVPAAPVAMQESFVDTAARAIRTVPELAAPQPADGGQVRQVFGKANPRQLRRGQLENHWYECFLYPLRGFIFIAGLGGSLALFTGIFILGAASVLEFRDESVLGHVLRLSWITLPFLAICYSCSFLHGLLTSAAAGQAAPVRWPGRDVSLALRHGMLWITCFLVGPFLPFALALIYWIRCGKPGLLDKIILGELVTLAVGYGLFTVVSLSRRERLRDIGVARVMELIIALGYVTPVIVVVASALFGLHGWWALHAVNALFKEPGQAWVELFGVWISGLFWLAFLLRMLGVHARRLPSSGAEQPCKDLA